MYAIRNLISGSLRTSIATATAVRGFSSQAVCMKDVVQDLYLKSLKTYKPKTQAAGSEAGQVKELRLPTAPEVPKIDEDIANELAAYDSGASADKQ